MADLERPGSFDDLLGELNALRLRLNKLEMTVQAMSRGSLAGRPESAHGAGASSLDEVFSVIGVLRGRLRDLEFAAVRIRTEAQASAQAESAEAEKARPVAPPPIPPQAPVPTQATVPAQPTAAPVAPTAPPAGRELQPAPHAARPTFEQRIGTRWLLIAGVIVTLLSAVFFFKYAIEQGWISPPLRVLAGAVVGLIMIGLGEWAFRRRMQFFAAGMIGGGVAMLYIVTFVASPNGLYNLIDSTPAFVLMCVVTVLAAALSLRTGMITTAILALIGALATPALLSTGENRQMLLMSYLLAVNAGFLAMALAKRWQALGPIALAGTVALFGGWFNVHYTVSQFTSTCAFAWSFLAVFVLCGVAGSAWRRMHDFTAIALTAAGGAAVAVLLRQAVLLPWGVSSGLETHALAQLFVLALVILGASAWRRWRWIRLGALIWLAPTMLMIWPCDSDADADMRWSWSIWIWLSFALFTGDVLVRAWLRRLRTFEDLDAVISSLATAAMFGATYFLLKKHHSDWMGAYTAVLSAGAFVAAWLVGARARRRTLSTVLLVQGLALLTLAVPIQYDRSWVAVSWAAMGVIVMLLARFLRNTTLLVGSLVALLLAVAKFLHLHFVGDEYLATVLATVGGVELDAGLRLAVGLTAAMLLSAALFRPPAGAKDERAFPAAVCLVCLAVLFYCFETACRLPVSATTWWWLVLAAGVAAAGLWRRVGWLSALGGWAIALAAGKWLAFDTLSRRLDLAAADDLTVVFNWQFAAGVALAGAVLAFGRLVVGRIAVAPRALRTWCPLPAAVMILWAGSFEIDRYFAPGRSVGWADREQAMQMTYSLWWALYAAAMLAVGMVRSHRPLRYLAIVLFAVTIAKVFLVDMRDVEAVYRILSFLGLGVLLVAASWLYYRYFRAASGNG